MLADAVLHDHSKVLIATKMHRPSATNERQRTATGCLRPAVAVEVRQKPIVASAVHVHRAAKGGLRQHAFHLGTSPIRTPIREKLLLTRPQQLQTRQVDFIRIILGVIDVVGPRSHFWNLPSRATLEFPILKDGKIHSTNI